MAAVPCHILPLCSVASTQHTTQSFAAITVVAPPNTVIEIINLLSAMV